MNYQFCLRTDTGLVRQNNEDSVLVHEASGLAVLADGMGGYNAGEVASDIATHHIANELAPWLVQSGERAPARDLQRALERCVHNANQAILQAARNNSAYRGMGTTLVVGAFQPSRLILAHVGDSRCYRWRDAVVTQLTRDHSLLQEQIDAGLLTPAQAAASAHRNLVTRALGVLDPVTPSVAEHRVEPGDLFLMCSDGLSDMVTDRELAAILGLPLSLEDKADQLVQRANANGGRDNVSVVLIQAAAALPRRRSLFARWLHKQ